VLVYDTSSSQGAEGRLGAAPADRSLVVTKSWRAMQAAESGPEARAAQSHAGGLMMQTMGFTRKGVGDERSRRRIQSSSNNTKSAMACTISGFLKLSPHRINIVA